MFGESEGTASPGREAAGTVGYAYRPTRPLSRWLVGVLLLGLALDLASSGIDAYVTVRNPGLFGADPESASPEELILVAGLALGGLATILVFVTGIVLFCMFVHRANRNARALGAEGMEFTPGWAVGWFFVPFANLFKPYQAMREIYLASDPVPSVDEEGTGPSWGWWTRPVPVQLSLWWGTWILANIIGNVGMRMSFAADPALQVTAAWLAVASAVVTIPCTLLVIWLIFEIEDRQAGRHAQRMQEAGLPQPR